MTPEAAARQHDALRRSLGVLAVLGVAYLGGEWSDSLAVWSHGRHDRAYAALPYACVAVAGVAAMVFTASHRWRVGGAVFCAAFAALYALAPVTYHNNLYLLWLYVLLATLTGGALRTTDAFARVVRAQVAVVYLGSVAVKLAHPFWQGSGAAIRWVTTVREPMLHQGLLNPIAQPWLSRRDVSSALDVATLAVETAIPVMLLTPRLRRAGWTLGALLHLLFQEWLYPQLFTFLMLWSYFAFAPVDDGAWAVTYDPSRPFDVTLARWYRRADWLGRTAWREGATLSLTTPDGRTREGMAVLRALATLTPVMVLAYAALALVAPGTRQVFSLPRDAVENVVVALWASAWIPGLWEGTLAKLRGRTQP